jgi:hypothetical protein
MPISRTVVIVAAVLVLAACRDHETITGGYGVRGASGVVTMAVGMSNSSPAGVRVAVGGTGMSAVLGTDVRFSIKKQGDRIRLSDLHLGTRIDDHTLKARQIEVRGVSGHH